MVSQDEIIGLVIVGLVGLAGGRLISDRLSSSSVMQPAPAQSVLPAQSSPIGEFEPVKQTPAPLPRPIGVQRKVRSQVVLTKGVIENLRRAFEGEAVLSPANRTTLTRLSAAGLLGTLPEDLRSRFSQGI